MALPRRRAVSRGQHAKGKMVRPVMPAAVVASVNNALPCQVLPRAHPRLHGFPGGIPARMRRGYPEWHETPSAWSRALGDPGALPGPCSLLPCRAAGDFRRAGRGALQDASRHFLPSCGIQRGRCDSRLQWTASTIRGATPWPGEWVFHVKHQSQRRDNRVRSRKSTGKKLFTLQNALLSRKPWSSA